MTGPKICPVCGGRNFSFREVLWPELISDWQLSTVEVDYINRQQGVFCIECGNNLRSMTLADAILFSYQYSGTLAAFVETNFAKTLNVLEINEAGGLTTVLKRMPKHTLVTYPDSDMTKLEFQSESFDLVVHSDTLEHVPNPAAGLSECRRVLDRKGRCIFTIPIIVGRLTRSRSGLKDCYHGSSSQTDNDFIVQTEFGADMWRVAVEAGFGSVRVHSFEYPSAFAIEAMTTNGRNTI